MTTPYDPEAAARWTIDQHTNRSGYQNIPDAIAPRTIEDAYAGQEALHRLLAPVYGPVVGLKIATTTRVMQELMGIDHPCGGAIFERRVHMSPARIACSDYQHLMLECELAVRLAIDLASGPDEWTRDTVRHAIATVMPAFELIEDRNAVYKSTKATSLIVDNAWNAGIVLGKPVTSPSASLDGIKGTLRHDGQVVKTGATDDPMGALAWVANLAARRGRPLKAGQVVITGSVIATFDANAGDQFSFALDGLGEAEVTIV